MTTPDGTTSDRATAEIPHFMGVRVPRREDPALLTGAGAYTGDLHLEKMLHLAIVRSPYAHAAIRAVDASQAEALDGVVAVLTAEDVNPHLARPIPAPYISKKYDVRRAPERYPLAAGRVRYVGDPVAVILAENAYVAADAADMVFVDYDPLPVIMDPEDALSEDAPTIYEEWGGNVGFRQRHADDDVDPIFASAAHVVESRTVNQRVIGNAMEPRAVVAQFDAEADSFTVWTPTQRPHSIRDGIAAVLDLPKENVRVIAPNVGGGFGIKASFYPEEVLVPFLARHFRRPVKWVASRSEDYLASVQGRGQITTLRLAADAAGRVQALDLDILMDCGAYYGHVTPYIPTYTALMIAGVYTVPAVRSQFTGVVTNKQASEPYRGAGRPEGVLAIERAMDLLAAEMGLDPVELRRRNFIPPDAFPYETPTGAVYDSGRYREALEKVLDHVDYQALRDEQARRRQEGGRLLGIGVSCYIEVCGFGPFEMGSVSVDEDANVTILSGTSPQGQGHETAWTQIAAGVLQIPPEAITVIQSDTGVVPRGVGTFGSRSAAVGGSAIFANAETVRDKARQIAGHMLEAAAEDVVLEDGRFHVAGVPDRGLSWREIARAAASDGLPQELQGGLNADEDFKPQGNLYPFGAHVCVVEVDPDTGETEIVRYVTVDDCGNVINPMLVAGQIHGGIAQGVGQALLEGAHYDEAGNLLTGTLLDYAVPRADNLPSYENHRTETPTPLNPMGVKGVGEAGTIGATPAVVNAVHDALSHLGVRNLEMPLTAEKVWQAINSSSA